MAAQIIILVMAFLSLLLAANKHGKERENHNFWYTLIDVIIETGIRYWGGFFDCFFK